MSRETSSKSRSYLQTICRPIWLDTSGTSIASSLGWFSAAKGGWERGASTWGHKLGAQVGSTWWEYGGVQSIARHDSPRVTKGPKVSRILPVSFPGDEEGNMNMIF